MKNHIKQLKVLQASSLVMFTKLHNYHWNIKGMQFFPVHEMTEKMYEQFSTLYDDCAERILQLGNKPFVLLTDLEKNSFIKEDKKSDFEAEYVLKNILADFETFLEEFKKLSKTAEKNDDSTTVTFADDNITHLEKNIWMIKATLS
ncbi:DNA starvation/stationary phase protection protein [Arcobacter sp. CECT 8983]|uniref:Dps family protein n=1 Tax=Arcobacter sp. CECT 8983 TaxID=2044508 RepID=UPI00100BC322|nr:DNA starvation/stationary phase protection protein [Arcobacter sp. CECT 8983]RXJ88955.1 DNA starvation/stationary phase protection protein [Arcobacter sp. CECT 8983]